MKIETRTSLDNGIALKLSAADVEGSTIVSVSLCPMIGWSDKGAPCIGIAYCSDFWTPKTREQFRQELNTAIRLLASNKESQPVFDQVVWLVSQQELELSK